MTSPHVEFPGSAFPPVDEEADADADADAAFDGEDATAEPDEPDEKEDRPEHSGRSRRGGSRDSSRTLIRRVAQKTAEVNAAPADQRALLASLLGCSDDPVDLTVAVMTSGRDSFRSVSDVLSIAEADAMEAGLTAAALGRPRMKTAWAILSEVGAVTGGMPSADMKAAIALAKGAKELSREGRDMIDAAVALGRKA